MPDFSTSDRLKCMMETQLMSFSALHISPSAGSRKQRRATYFADAAGARNGSHRRAGMGCCLDAQLALTLRCLSSAA